MSRRFSIVAGVLGVVLVGTIVSVVVWQSRNGSRAVAAADAAGTRGGPRTGMTLTREPGPAALAEPSGGAVQANRRGQARGRIVDFDSGSGVPFVRISSWAGGLRTTLTDTSGNFVLDELPTGKPLKLRVEKQEGYLSEVIDTEIPVTAAVVDVGSTRLLTGNWDKRFSGNAQGLTGINSERREDKVYVTKVRSGTPAEAAGVKPGDRILAIDGKQVDQLGHRARSFLLQGDPGSNVSLVLVSPAGERREVSLKRVAATSPRAWPFAQNRPASTKKGPVSPAP
jgi:membrane-associated protease RseP (regulator of RpoE activity)